MYKHTRKIIVACLFMAASYTQAAVPLSYGDFFGKRSRSASDVSSMRSLRAFDRDFHNSTDIPSCGEICTGCCFCICQNFIKIVTCGMWCAPEKDAEFHVLNSVAKTPQTREDWERLLATQPTDQETDNEYGTFPKPASETDKALIEQSTDTK